MLAVRAQYDKIHFQNLKTHIQKFKFAIEKRITKIEDLRQVSAAGSQGRGKFDPFAVEWEARGIMRQSALEAR